MTIPSSIYISSSCVKNRKMIDSILQLVEEGFTNIELSGGTDYYPGLLSDLLDLQEKYGLKYRCHNYFPPPREHFVLNLSAFDKKEACKSRDHVLQAVNMSKALGGSQYGIHAGFRIQPKLNELGNRITRKEMVGLNDAVECYSANLREIRRQFAPSNLALYVENNVFSRANFESFSGVNPFLATDYKSISEFFSKVDARLLLDVAHLKVSCKTLGLDFSQELSLLIPDTDYLHISDNDGTADTNEGLRVDSELYELLSTHDLGGKTFTLEVYDGIDSLKESCESLVKILDHQGLV